MEHNIQNNVDVVERIRQSMVDNVGILTFTKVDGSTRVITKATLMSKHIPAPKPDYVPKQEGGNVVVLEGNLTFYSIEDAGFRSCKVKNIISWQDQYGTDSPNFPSE